MESDGVSANDDAIEVLFDLVLDRIENGLTVNVEDFLTDRPELRSRVDEVVQLAREVAAGKSAPTLSIPGYSIVHEIGRGGMGTVFLARQDSAGGRLVALKVLPSHVMYSENSRSRFVQEANTLAKLRHPHIVTVFDVIHRHGLYAYAMEWVDGKSLAQVIRHLHAQSRDEEGEHDKRPFRGRRSREPRARGDAGLNEQALRNSDHSPDSSVLPISVVQSYLGGSDHGRIRPLDRASSSYTTFICQIGIGMARALGEVHRHEILHRDVKPSNILMRRDGTPLLSDFGLVRETDTTIATQTGHFVGTPAYASPEQLRGDHDAMDVRSDVYSLGVTLYHALTLRLPFRGHTPTELLSQIEAGQCAPIRRIRPALPRDLETIVAKAMDADPARRYATAGDFADDLERLLTLQPIKAKPATLATRMWKAARRNRAGLFGAVIGSVIALALTTVAAAYWLVLPKWTQQSLTQARLALLDPEQGNAMFDAEFFGVGKPSDRENIGVIIRPEGLSAAIGHYDAALRWQPFDREIQREREVVQLALAKATKRRSDGGKRGASGDEAKKRSPGGTTVNSPGRKPWEAMHKTTEAPEGRQTDHQTTHDPAAPLGLAENGARPSQGLRPGLFTSAAPRLEPPSASQEETRVGGPPSSLRRSVAPSLRTEGLLAYLTGDAANAIDAWTKLDLQSEPDAFINAALGQLYVARGEHARAYPRLSDAVDAFPYVSFLTQYLADAAVQCGDLDKAQQWLDLARMQPMQDRLRGCDRIQADLLAAQGRDDEADQLYRAASIGNPIAMYNHGLFLESRDRFREAISVLQKSVRAVPSGARQREAFVRCMNTWWNSLAYADRWAEVRGALDESGAELFVAWLKAYAQATKRRSDEGERTGYNAVHDGRREQATSQDIPRSDRVAEGDGAGRASVHSNSNHAGLGEIRPDVADAPGGRIDPFKHSRRSRPREQNGLPPLPPDRERLSYGTSNASPVGNTVKVPNESGQFDEPITRGRPYPTSADPQLGKVEPTGNVAPNPTTPPSLRRFDAPSLSASFRRSVAFFPALRRENPASYLQRDAVSLTTLAGKMEVQDVNRWNYLRKLPSIIKDWLAESWLSPRPTLKGAIAEWYADLLATIDTLQSFLRASPHPLRRSVAASLVSISSLGLIPPALAQGDFDYDFESLILNQPLIGQDGWQSVNSSWGGSVIVIGVGADSTKTAVGDSTGGAMGALRYYDQPYYYTSNDAAIEWRCWGMMPPGCCQSALAGMSINVTSPGVEPSGETFGIDTNIGGPLRTFVGASPGSHLGDAMEFNHWYEFKLIVDFSVSGASATLLYRDLTLGQSGFTTDSFIQNKNLGLTPDCLGRYPFFAPIIRNNHDSYVDNLHFDAPSGAGTPPQMAPYFTGLGDLPGGTFESFAAQISADGTTVVGVSKTSGGYEGFRWTIDTGMTGLGTLPGLPIDDRPQGVSADGNIAVGIGHNAVLQEAWRWESSTGIVSLGCTQSHANGISDDGLTIGGATSCLGGFLASKWTQGTGWQVLSGATNPSSAYGMSRNGQWFTGAIDTPTNGAFRWSQATGMTYLGNLPGGAGQAHGFGISDDGAVVVGLAPVPSGWEAFVWTASSGIVGLTDLPGGDYYSNAESVLPDGSIIVGTMNSSTGQEAVMWDDTLTMHRVADVLAANGVAVPCGWTLRFASGITENCGVITIVGRGTNPDGNTEGWIASYLPGSPPVDPNSCDDGSACTINDTCSGIACVGTPINCNDNNVCTTDSCNSASGCQHVDISASCNDGNVCTTDSCNPASGCGNANNTIACNDNNACTINDTCSAGSCGGTPVDPQVFCDDSNECTNDGCSTLTGCTHVNNTDTCDDDNSCTTDDVCLNGVCAGDPPPPWGDVHPVGAPNGTVSLDDILCVIGGFASPAACPDADIVPCAGNGTINLDDILGVLSAFSGANQCPCVP